MKSNSYIKGRPQKIFVLDYGLFKVHANGRVIGICGFLIQTDAEETILIDSGFPEKYAYDIEKSSKEDRLGEFGEVLECTPGNLPNAQLAKAGVLPADIDLFITTHTHIDHIGGLSDFQQAPMIIAKAERDLPKPLYWGGAQPMDWPEREYIVIDEDTNVGPGFDILLSPGHAPGQLAFLIELPETGFTLITSDAISRPAEVEEKFAGSWNETLAQESAARLMKIADDHDAFVIYGHSPEQWRTLKKIPEFYG